MGRPVLQALWRRFRTGGSRLWGGRMNLTQTADQITGSAVQMSIEGASKRFGGVVAVDGVSIGIPRGRILSIIGPNGAGKTSLLNMISGFYRPDAGRIVLDGRDITGLRPSAIATSLWMWPRPETSACFQTAERHGSHSQFPPMPTQTRPLCRAVFLPNHTPSGPMNCTSGSSTSCPGY